MFDVDTEVVINDVTTTYVRFYQVCLSTTVTARRGRGDVVTVGGGKFCKASRLLVETVPTWVLRCVGSG